MTAGASRWLDEDKADAAALLSADGENSCLLALAEQLCHFGHWRVNLPAFSITWSKAVYEIHGVTPDRYTPELETAIGFYHPDDRETVTSAIAAAAQDGTPFELSLRLVRTNGELRQVQSRGMTIPGPDGAPAAIFGVSLDVTEEQEANLALERIAYMDVLTGLANRRHFDDTLEREWRRATREHTALSLILLDIDRFRIFNDLYGHAAADDCLRSVAGAMASVVHRPADLAARYGGEEFALILPVTDATGAQFVARGVRTAVAALGLTHAGNASCGGVVTASLGVATAHPQRGDAPGAWFDLIAEAGALLHEAKRTGRNRVVSPIDIAYDVAAPLPENEQARLAALAVYELAGATARCADLDRIAWLAAVLMSTPIGLVSLVGRQEERFAGNFGLEGLDRTGRDISFCAHTILGDDPFVVPDATHDRRFAANPLVRGDLGLRYYAGAPIISETTGHRLGALCVIDKSPRAETNPAQRALLTDLAKMAAAFLGEKLASPVTS